MFSGDFMEMIENAAPLVVCDAGPVIHLDELGCIDLLSSFSRVLIPLVVWKEVERHRPRALTLSCFEKTAARQPEPPQLETVAIALSLHTGEWEAIRVALEHPQSVLLTDDTAARLAAGNLGIRVHGTIGVLVRSMRKGIRTKQFILEALRSIPNSSSLHLKRSLLDSVITQVEEHS
jgi:predicted nucleic acid-binding protein